MTDTRLRKPGGISPSQTVGPFFHYGLIRPGEEWLLPRDVDGPRIRVEGRVYDGGGAPIGDALLEIWQADADGNFPGWGGTAPANAGFTGFGRVPTSSDGHYAFETVIPGPVPAAAGGMQAPHLSFNLFARGLLNHLHGRIYFADHLPDPAADPVLALVEPARRATLIATRVPDAALPTYRLDIHLQGPAETVFFRL